MATKKKNNLTLAKVKKVSKQLEEIEVHEIEDGLYKGEQITFSPIFDDKTIEELLTEFGNLLNDADEKGIELSQRMQIYLIYMLIIKHFTHFKESLPSSLLGQGKSAGLLDTLEHFHKTGLLSECLNNMFMPKEVNKVLDKMTDFAATGLLANELDQEMITKFEQLKLRNADVFEQLGKIKTDNTVE
jgi:hypothetical protein